MTRYFDKTSAERFEYDKAFSVPQSSEKMHRFRHKIHKSISDPVRVAKAQGHDSEAYCVATAPQWYILSGGSDCTTRVWSFFGEPLTCYQLIGVVVHRHSVTSVAITDRCQPRPPLIVSATRQEGLFIWDMDTNRTKHHTMGGVTHMDLKRDDLQRKTWLLAVGAGKKAHLVIMQETTLETKIIGTFMEDDHIRQVSNVVGDLSDGAAIATCTNEGVTLWSLAGLKIAVLQEPSGKEIRGFSLNMEDNDWLLLIAGGEDEISVWALQPANTLRGSARYLCHEPLVQYRIPERVRRVAIVKTHEAGNGMLLFITRQDGVSQLLDVSPDEGRPAKGEAGLPSKFVDRGYSEVRKEVNHVGMVNDMSFFTDPEQHELRLVVALTDGRLIVWDLVGADAGQIVGELRSLASWELCLPIAEGVIFWFQMSILAFGPYTKWQGSVKNPAGVAYKIAMFEYEGIVDIGGSTIFWTRSLGVLTLMTVFVIFTLFAMPDRILRWKQHAEQRYGVKHCCYRSLSVLRVVVELIMRGCVSVLAIPTYKTWANIYDCDTSKDGPAKIRSAPELNCLEDVHLALAIGTLPIGIIYTVLLFPHFVVDGDTNYVMYGSWDLLKPERLRQNAERYCTTSYQGFVHPNKQYTFRHAAADLIVKTTMPCIAILMSRWPLPQMITLSVIATLHFLLQVINPQWVDKGTAAFFQSMRLFTLSAMLCGTLTVVDDGKHRQLAIGLFIVIVGIIVLGTILLVTFQRMRLLVAGGANLKIRIEDLESREPDDDVVEDDEDDCASLTKSFQIADLAPGHRQMSFDSRVAVKKWHSLPAGGREVTVPVNALDGESSFPMGAMAGRDVRLPVYAEEEASLSAGVMAGRDGHAGGRERAKYAWGVPDVPTDDVPFPGARPISADVAPHEKPPVLDQMMTCDFMLTPTIEE